MYKNSKQLSASEINRYIYCPYQWYYERKFGRKVLLEKYKQANEELGLFDQTQSNFNRGLKFHSRFDFFLQVKKILKICLAIAIFILIIYLVFRFL